jgi:glutaconate CoA-transferase subunit A
VNSQVEKARALEEAAAEIPDGATVFLGGTVLDRKPMALVRALAAAGTRDLDLVTFAGSLDVDVLVGAGAVRSVAAAYVGLGSLGSAPRYRAAVESGVIEDREYTEWTLLGRLRAAAMGVPFLPTRAAHGSEVVDRLGLRPVENPYDGTSYLALPPLHPDVAVLHAWRASPVGDVQLAFPPQHLWDVDVVAAHASRRVVVSVEEIVDEAVIFAEPHLTVLFGHQVDAVVLAPGGAWPSSCPPDHEGDHAAVAAYRASGGDPASLAGANAA